MKKKLLLLALVTLIVTAVLLLDPERYLSLSVLRQEIDRLQELIRAEPGLAAAAYLLAYVAVAALSLPGAAIMTLAGGALFGLVQGTLLASFASTVGATLAFWTSRYFLRGAVERRFTDMTRRINRGIDREGAYYLFAMRLVPIFPFFVLNLVMGLTRLRTWTFYWVSQLGMLPVTLVYVNAGTQLRRVSSLGDILSPGVAGSLVLLGVFPLIARRLAGMLRARRIYARFDRPRHFDANVVVIGAGAAGLVTAWTAAAARAKVVLIEADRMGGDCLNRGCVPSKALLKSARLARQMRSADAWGLAPADPGAALYRVMERVRRAIARVEPHDSVARYTALGVECVAGRARIVTPWTVEVGDRRLHTRSVVIATGSRPDVPPIPGIDSIPFVTTDSVWSLDTLPPRLLVLGGGAAGCELAQAFAGLGSRVTLVEQVDALLPSEEPEASRLLRDVLEEDGVRVHTGCRALRFEALARGGGRLHVAMPPEDPEDFEFDLLLLAAGRRADTAGLGLEALGVELGADGRVVTNEFLQTNVPNVYACGDVTSDWRLTHVAGHEGWHCGMNALFGRFFRLRVDYRAVPRAVYTEPEVARVGLTESEASDEGLDVGCVTYDLAELDRAIADGAARGFVKVVTPTGRDRILGATVVGPRAGDIIHEFALAMRHGLGLRRILATVHAYPTYAEAVRLAAGEWQRQRLPGRLLAMAGWLHRRARREAAGDVPRGKQAGAATAEKHGEHGTS